MLAPSHLPGFSSINPSLWTINIKTFVTTMLDKFDDYLSWKTQFVSFLVMHQLHGFVDGLVSQPPIFVVLSSGLQQPNPGYATWLHLDQLIRAWLFATVSKDLLTKVRDLLYCFPA